MSGYQGGHGQGGPQGHDLQEYPPSTYHMPPPRDYDSDNDENVPLTQDRQPRASPFGSPFDDGRGGQYGGQQPQQAGYSLSESYVSQPAYGDGAGYPQDGYGQSGVQFADPTQQFGVPRVPSPYARSETSSTERSE